MNTRFTLPVALLVASAVLCFSPALVRADEKAAPETLKMKALVEYPMGEFPQSVTLADLNGDDFLDAITANRGVNGKRVGSQIY